MSQLDETLRGALSGALSAEDLRALDALAGEQSLIAQALYAFDGQQLWVRVVGWGAGFGLFGVGAYAAWRFVQAADTRGMLLWGALAALAFMGLVMIKLWFFMEMQKNTIVREVKRLELQVAGLARLQAR